MKRFFAFILLICHMNASMFLPQMPEVDTYDANGNQTDDINSVAEYIAVALGYDYTADDEDDDSGQNFHLANAVDYYYEPVVIIIEPTKFIDISKLDFSEHKDAYIKTLAFDIITPPP